MAARPPPPEEHPLAGHVERLTEELQAIGDILEGIRTDLAWGLQNGRVVLSLAELDRLEHVADATLGQDVFDLTLRLHTALALFGADLTDAVERHSQSPQASVIVDAPLSPDVADSVEPEFVPTVVLYEIGDAVEFEHDGEELFGEIVAVDDARNEATIMLIPSGEELVVCQDNLTKSTPDGPAYKPLPVQPADSELLKPFVVDPRPPLAPPRPEPHRAPSRQRSLF